MAETSQVIKVGDSTVWRTGSAFEKLFEYCRAVRRGPIIAVAGTTAAALSSDKDNGPGEILFPGDARGQAKLAMQRCIEAVVALGGKTQDIIRIRMFVADGRHCNAVGQAFKEIFGLDYNGGGNIGQNQSSGVAATMIVVPGGFVDGGMLVEVEADAYVL